MPAATLYYMIAQLCKPALLSSNQGLASTVLPVLPMVWYFPDPLITCMCVSLVLKLLFNSILPVPAPMVSILPGGGATAFAGSQLTLICIIILDPIICSLYLETWM